MFLTDEVGFRIFHPNFDSSTTISNIIILFNGHYLSACTFNITVALYGKPAVTKMEDKGILIEFVC